MGGRTEERRALGAPWPRILLAAYVAMLVGVSVQRAVCRPENNFAIFRAASAHLLEGKDLYASYPELHSDLFKYPPPFALLFRPFALPPVPVGLFLWNGLNALVLFVAIGRLLPPRPAFLVRALVFLEVMRSMQNSQSNALLTGLVLLSFVALERRAPRAGALAAVVGGFTKVFPLGAAAFGIFHPGRLRYALTVVATLVVVGSLPLLVTSPERLVGQYASWLEVQRVDGVALEDDPFDPTERLYGGVMQQFRIWFGGHWPNLPFQVAGTALLLLPLLRGPPRWRDPAFRRLFLCSFLVYAVVFNHQAESPTMIVAMTGIAIWYATGPRTAGRTALMALSVLVVSVSSLEVTPAALRDGVFLPYRLKTVPCVAAWLWLQVDLWTQGRSVGRRLVPEGRPRRAAAEELRPLADLPA